MWDNTPTPPQKKAAKEKCMYPSLIWLHRNKMYAKEKVFYY